MAPIAYNELLDSSGSYITGAIHQLLARIPKGGGGTPTAGAGAPAAAKPKHLHLDPCDKACKIGLGVGIPVAIIVLIVLGSWCAIKGPCGRTGYERNTVITKPQRPRRLPETT
ncbi:hypothetical protein P171DRAFT_491374 [Karstenula rhodostoma CBS 690.94]|uniref:Uncharacterized protein n=1 Tax=Karstenula rhodostoma CBS 690.94 TaxID=1392251 RepID=A0A9P4U6J7_9PLEO|nr:hypothetical protein P171DRAFT_491374 [Karstenula rhodostoma CBS 690.94]